MKSLFHVVRLSSLLVLLTACGGGDDLSRAPRANIPFTSDISINEVMVGQIDHAAHFILDTINPELPVQEIDWGEVEHHAVQLISSRAAMTMGGTGVNDAMWIAQVSWREYVNSMNEAGLLALQSARSQNRDGLIRTSDILIETCESCHQQFKPTIPTEGFTHPH